MSIEDSIIQYNEVFEGEPWFGTSILKSLQDIPLLFWNKKPEKASHSILELVYHLVDWRIFVIEKLKENKTFDIKLNTEQDWRKDVFISTEKQKKEVIKELVGTQNVICELLKKKTEEWRHEEVAGKVYKNEYMIRGILQHDIYHLGQINMTYSQLK